MPPGVGLGGSHRRDFLADLRVAAGVVDTPYGRDMAGASLSLVVLRTPNVTRLRTFYESLGMEFVDEKHGDGPVHASMTLGDLVVEIYPGSGVIERGSVADVRLGFSVDSLAEVRASLVGAAGQSITRGGSEVLVLRDPDGRAVEVQEL